MPSANFSPMFEYLLQLGDNALILSHRLSEWCGHGPVLEQDIALTNISLDILGQARLWYQYAGEITSPQVDEDTLAYMRDAHEFRNILLVEQPNGDWGKTIVRQCFYDTFQLLLLEELKKSNQQVIAEIAAKCLTETTYHAKWSSQWVIRLGDGTEESNHRMQTAVNDLWRFRHEAVLPSVADKEVAGLGMAPNLDDLKEAYFERLGAILQKAGLLTPDAPHVIKGGKDGVHSEHLGFILAEMQHLQRSYPGLEW